MWDLVGNPEERFSHNDAHFRPTLVVLSLGLALVLADVDIKMKSMKADKRNPEMARFTGACAYGPDDLDFGEEDPAAESLSMTIQFDRPVQGFKVLSQGRLY